MSSCCQTELLMKIKFKDKETYKDFNHIEQGDWIDLRVNETITIKKGDFFMIDLGIAMELPKGYEAIVVPRSSTFKKYGIIQTNSIGLIVLIVEMKIGGKCQLSQQEISLC